MRTNPDECDGWVQTLLEIDEAEQGGGDTAADFATRADVYDLLAEFSPVGRAVAAVLASPLARRRWIIEEWRLIECPGATKRRECSRSCASLSTKMSPSRHRF
jgi:hypothetical protein